VTARRTWTLALATLALMALAVSVKADSDPIAASDLIGTWKTKDGKSSFMLALASDGTTLQLQSHYTDWRVLGPFNPASGGLTFDRVATEDDIRSMILDKAQDPPPASVVSSAAGAVTESFTGIAARDTHWYSSERCDIAMHVRWTGFHIAWDANGDWHRTSPDPVATKDYHLVRYAFFDTTKVAIRTHVNDAPDIREDQRVLIGTEVQGYFDDRAATALFGEFTKALFEPIFDSVTGVVPAESVAGKLATKLLKTTVSKSLTGDVSAQDFVKFATEQVLDSIIGAAGQQEPFVSIQAEMKSVYGESISDWIASNAAGAVKKAGAAALTPAQSDALAKYLKNQCRIRIASLPAHGPVTGGLVIADTQLGTARILLHMSAHGSRPAVNLQGDVGIPAEGTPPSGIPEVYFSIVP